MSYPTHDTDWAESTQGNDWKRIDGKVDGIASGEKGATK